MSLFPQNDTASPACPEAAVETLLMGDLLLSLLDENAYTRPFPEVFNATIGGHYRHILEHFQLVIDSPSVSVLCYEKRKREEALETSHAFARLRTRKLADRFSRIDEVDESKEVLVSDTLTGAPGSSSVVCRSSFGRETMYAVHHAVHHFAMIRIMGNLIGVPFPEGFGVAGSTLRHWQDRARQERMEESTRARNSEDGSTST